jgi:hypothetical protein
MAVAPQKAASAIGTTPKDEVAITARKISAALRLCSGVTSGWRDHSISTTLRSPRR